MKKISKLLDVFEKICVEICVILLAVIALSIFYQVVARKLGYSVTWVDETTRYAMVLLVFLGTLEIARHGQHIRIVSFVDMLPPGLRKMTEILTYLLDTLGSVLIWEGLYMAFPCSACQLRGCCKHLGLSSTPRYSVKKSLSNSFWIWGLLSWPGLPAFCRFSLMRKK
jgi:TRAP-type mannitol/chloroaromatic compound transport system permease small subunit